jgi:hypothetical protein
MLTLETRMHPLRGYDSLSLGNLFQGAVPAPLYSLDVQNTADGQYESAPPPVLPSRRSGLTHESVAALKQAMRRIAPHVPPEVLQRHYINRLAELSNPTPDTLYPVASHEAPSQPGETPGAFDAVGQSAPNAPSQNPFAAAAMASIAQHGNGPLQSISEGDAPISIGDLMGSVTPTRLSAANMPSVMEDPAIVRARARLARSPAALGHVQPLATHAPFVSPEYLQGHVRTPSLSVPAFTNALDPGESQTEADHTQVDTTAPNGSTDADEDADSWWDWAPIVGPIRALKRDYKKGQLLSAQGALDGVLLATDLVPESLLLKAPAWAIAKGLAKGAMGKDVVREVPRELKKIVKTGSNKWKDTKAWILRNYDLPANTHVHHAFIPQRKGKAEPKWLINQWWNLVPLTDWKKFGFNSSQEMHWAIDRMAGMRFSENPFLNEYYRTIYRYPQWAKTLAGSSVANILDNSIRSNVPPRGRDESSAKPEQ